MKAFGQETHEISEFQQHLDKKKGEMLQQSWYFGLSKALLEATMYLIPFYGQLMSGIFILLKVKIFILLYFLGT